MPTSYSYATPSQLLDWIEEFINSEKINNEQISKYLKIKGSIQFTNPQDLLNDILMITKSRYKKNLPDWF